MGARSQVREWVARARRRGWLPPTSPRPPWRELLPATRSEGLTTVLLVFLVAGYVAALAAHNQGMLTDPLLHNDDTRKHCAAFHTFNWAGDLKNSPNMQVMLQRTPPVIYGLYRVLVPLTGLLVAVKIVQALAFGVFFVGAAAVWRERRAGLAVAAVLLALALREWLLIYVVGGQPRGFGYPALFLWICGALTQRGLLRGGAVVLAAGSYPPVALILLAAEGLFTLRDRSWCDRAVLLPRLKRYAVLATVSVVLVMGFKLFANDLGSLPTLAEARQRPEFSEKGAATRRVPFRDPTGLDRLARVYEVKPDAPLTALNRDFAHARQSVSWLVVLLLGLGYYFARWRPPDTLWALVFATLLLGAASSLLAFKLYLPDRFVNYGMAGAGLCLAPGLLAQRWWQGREAWQQSATIAFLLAMSLLGLGVREDLAISVDGHDRVRFHQEISELPQDILIGGHPRDLDDIPLFARRRVVIGLDMSLPWLDRLYRQQVKRIVDGVDATYSTEPADLIAYCHKYGVTHLCVNYRRYRYSRREDKVIWGIVFAPHTVDYLAAKWEAAGWQTENLAIAKLPRQALVTQEGDWTLVDVAAVEAHWRANGLLDPPTSPP